MEGAHIVVDAGDMGVWLLHSFVTRLLWFVGIQGFFVVVWVE